MQLQKNSFASLHLADPILRAVAAEGYSTPTPIQAQAIPHIMNGKDVLGCAQTGTGKTAAFSLPILHRLTAKAAGAGAPHTPRPNQHQHRPTRVLILSPTRELALQIDESLRTYGRNLHLRTVCVFGGVNQNPQTRALKQGVDILVATPGRLMDLMQQGYVDLRHVEIFVLDEADRMLDMGFIDPIRQITAKIPAKRQTLLFSATMPKEIRHLADSLLSDPVRIEVAAVSSTPELVEQSVFMVTKRDKPALLAHVLKTNAGANRVLVFTRTKHGADRVARDLNRAGIPADAIHGNKRQNVRQRTLSEFRAGRTRVLVATDIAARGIDVDAISHVVNFDVPHEPETYVHRIGRTARAGASGRAMSFCDQGSDERSYLRLIEKLIRKPIRVEAAVPNLPPPEARPAREFREEREQAREQSRFRQQRSRYDASSHRTPHRSPERPAMNGDGHAPHRSPQRAPSHPHPAAGHSAPQASHAAGAPTPRRSAAPHPMQGERPTNTGHRAAHPSTGFRGQSSGGRPGPRSGRPHSAPGHQGSHNQGGQGSKRAHRGQGSHQSRRPSH